MRIFKPAMQALLIMVLLLSEASVFVTPVEAAEPIVEGNTVRISLNDAYIEASPATLTASGWVEVTFWTRYYDGAVDVVYGFNGLDNVKAINPQVWESHIETKTRQAMVTKTEEFIPEKVISTNTLAKAPVGTDLSLNTKYVEIVSEGATDNRTGLKTPITTKLAYDSYNASTGAYWVKTTSLGVEEYTEAVTGYNERPQPVTNTLSYAGANKWDIAQYKSVVKNEVQKTRVWIDIIPQGKLVNGKYNIGIKPSSLTLQQAKDQGKLWLLDPWYSITYTNSGGTITTDGLYTVHKFTSDGTFVCGKAGDVEVLVVGGGGAGGGSVYAGGGGAGGLVYHAAKTLTAGNKTVTVGAGGTGVASADGNDGNDSVFDDITAEGGGGGGKYTNVGKNGGSGGGGAGEGTSGITNVGGTKTQGNSGGGTGYGYDGGTGQYRAGGGGGGAGAVGGNGDNTDNGNGGNGGVGRAYDIVLDSTNVYYAGGGGGGVYQGTPGTGGNGGGGAGTTSAAGTPTAGTANTGGGGGGSGGGTGAAGGSGIVVIRCLTEDFSDVSCALAGNITTATEPDIVTGGKVITLTLSHDTWVASGATFNAIRDDIIAGMDSAQSEAGGWDAKYKAEASTYVADVVRTNDTVVTVTMSALAAYSITATENITVTVPSTAVTGAAAYLAYPNFFITNVTGATVTTQAGSSVEATTATGNGNLTDDAGLTITERGICYSSVTNPPTIADSTSAAAGVGEGAYTAALSGLSTGTTYYLRAYVKSDEPATYYGSTVNILTKPAAPTGVSATDGTDTAKVVITWTKSTGATDYHVWRDAVDLGAAGDVATADDAGADAPIITGGTVTATDGTSSTEVTLSLAGESVANGTTHTYKVVASNATGDSADSATNTGYIGHGSITYQWQVSAADSDAAYGNIGGATTDPYSYTSAPAPVITAGAATASDGTSATHSTLTATTPPSAANGAGRYYKCVVSATGATNVTTAFNTGYRGTTTLTFAWQVSAADSDAAFGALAGATTNPYNDATAVVDPDGRWYYCIVSMVGATPADTTHNRGYRAAFAAPTVVTGICSGSGTTWAGLNGMVTDQGDAAVSQYGFEYGLTTAYGTDSLTTANTANNVSYFKNLATLTPSTIYHYRAKAFNTAWGYGADAIFATKGSPAINVNFNAGSDNCTAIWGVNVGAQTLTTSATTEYTVTSVRLEMLRVGLPGTVTVSIRRATAGAGNAPTGVDLTSGTINGNTLATSAAWYDITMATQTTLELNSTYAIVVSAANGDVSNYVCWRKVNAGGFANGNADTSVNSGVTWTAQTWDNMFELWGNQALEIQDAKVFQSYSATGDWLVTVRYVNVYAPYYDTYDVKKYFTLQLVDSTGVVKASTVMPAWGNRVGSIYLSAVTVSPLTYGGDYRVRIQGTFTGTPYTEYALVGADWLGDDLVNLDSWVLTSSTVIGTYYATTMTTFVAERGEVLNSTGAGVFSNGIAGLSQVRPAIFQTYTVPSTYTPGTITQAGRTAIPAWQTNVGPDATVMLTRVGNIVGIGGDIIAIIAFLIMMFVLMALAFPAGNTTAAMVLSLPMLGAAIWFGMDLLYIGMLALVAAFLFIKNFWLDKGN